MKIPRNLARQSAGVNMTPMIDVVFLLIIFFLVSSHLARQESRMELALPIAKSGAEDVDLETPRVTINVAADGKLFIAGRMLPREQLPDTLRELRQTEGENLEVRIRSSRETPYLHVEPIMMACTQSSIWNVSYAVYREEPK